VFLSFALCQKESAPMKQEDLRDTFKKTPPRMWDVVVPHDPLALVPSYSSATQTPENR